MKKLKEPVLTTDTLLDICGKLDGVDELRFLVATLGQVNQRELFDKDTYYPVNIDSYATKCGLTLSKAYAELKTLIERLRQESYRIPLDTGETWVISLVYSYIYDDDAYTLRVKWVKELIPFISGEQKDNTYCITEGAAAALSSSHQIRLVTLLQRHLYKLNHKPYTFTIPVVELRRYTGTSDTYKEYYELNRNIIRPGIAGLAKFIGVELDYKGNKREVTFWRK